MLLTGVIKKVRYFATSLMVNVFALNSFKQRGFFASSRLSTCDTVFYHTDIVYVSINVFLLCECFFLFLH